MKALCIAGPTASGKSALAMAAALRWPVEIISVDSAQVYCGLDIGTAKPSAQELADVPHHLINILPPTGAYSAAAFVQDARRLITEINARGRSALLVGGTMLYFKALADGLDTLPAANPALRAQIDARAAQLGWPALHAELAELDAVTAARLKPHDAQRIQRALEVCQLSGQPMSALFGQSRSLGLALPMLALEPTDRAWLHRRIALRFELMLDLGLVDELRRLREQWPLTPELPAMRCVGYRQAWTTIDSGRFDLLAELGIAATRQLAKRQLTWLRSMDREALPCDAPDLLPRALDWLAPRLQPAGTSV